VLLALSGSFRNQPGMSGKNIEEFYFGGSVGTMNMTDSDFIDDIVLLDDEALELDCVLRPV